MAYDAALPIGAPIFAPYPARPQYPPPAAADCMSARFRPHEGVSLAIGGLAGGALAGAFAFFALGRVEAWIPLTAALAAYGFALYLVGLSLREVLAGREMSSIVLYGLHVAALLAWPIIILLSPPTSWPIWFGLPIALTAASMLFLIAPAPASAMFRTSAHVFMITAIGAYQWLWTAMSVPAW